MNPIMVKETTKEKIIISKDMDSEGLHYKEDPFPLGTKVSFSAIVTHAMFLFIKSWIVELMQENIIEIH